MPAAPVPPAAGPSGRLPAAFHVAGAASFVDLVAGTDPSLLPGRRPLPAGALPPELDPPHATTIVALTYPGGVVMAGDRRATAGSMIAHREIEKVFPADAHSCVGIAGTAGIAVEMVRLFQVELEHFEKIEGAVLSLDGKANRLSAMVRGNLGLAMQGLAVVPLFAGYDVALGRGRIFSYDVTGGRYEERGHHSVGSGSVFAKGALKKLHRPTRGVDDAVATAVEALHDAADDDSATGGADLVRGVVPVVAVVDEAGYRRVPDERVLDVAREVLAARTARHEEDTQP